MGDSEIRNSQSALPNGQTAPASSGASRILAEGRRCRSRYLCVEDNDGGGLGSAVAEIVAASGSGRVEVMTCQRIPKSGRTPADVLRMVGLSPEDIITRVRRLVS